MENNKKGRPFARWAINLKTGTYTVEELMKITGQKRKNIRQFMIRHCEEKIDYEKSNGKIICVYIWNNPNDKKEDLCVNLE